MQRPLRSSHSVIESQKSQNISPRGLLLPCSSSCSCCCSGRHTRLMYSTTDTISSAVCSTPVGGITIASLSVLPSPPPRPHPPTPMLAPDAGTDTAAAPLIPLPLVFSPRALAPLAEPGSTTIGRAAGTQVGQSCSITLIMISARIGLGTNSLHCHNGHNKDVDNVHST